ncbi:hypothetical protein [Thermoactinospora rubra]|uniref:hypothetical protein n=1 Tax=Thermoactinospora rubra TaxID=1088767 RepID=UPI00130209F4|nr:hypothetical protein [Thermoactinospora rubra]
MSSDLKSVSYELCAAGGLMFIRRTVTGGSKTIVQESEWLIASRARELWRRVLKGEII